MYKVTDVCIYAIIKVSLYPKNDKEKDRFTSWDVFTDDIYDKLEDHSFEKMPTEKEVRKLVEKLIDEHVEEIMDRYPLYEMLSLSIMDENNNYCDDLELDDFDWGVLEDIDLNLDGYEVEEIN